MEGPEKEDTFVPPIATTPPHPGPKGELLSQSSSGTQISTASGLSLGEAIKRRSALNRDMETWYLPCAETDNSNMTASLRSRLGQTRRAHDLSEFSSMEEGVMSPTEESRRLQAPSVTHTPLLEIRDTHLSPNLPLLTTYSSQGRTFFNETLFQQTGMDFAPLRATPDVSNIASERAPGHLRMSEAVRLAATDASLDSCLLSDRFSLSQHPMAFSTVAASGASFSSSLSQHPLSLSGHVPAEPKHHHDEKQTRDSDSKSGSTKDENFGGLGSLKLTHQQLDLPEESQGVVAGHDLFLLDSTVPTPLLLEMLEKEIGLSKHCGFLSSESSSCKSVLEKDPEENESSPLVESQGQLPASASEAFAEPPQQEGRTIPQGGSLDLPHEEEKRLRRARDSEQPSASVPQVLASSKGHEIGLGDSCIITGVSPCPLPNKQQVPQASEAVCQGRTPGACRLDTSAPFQLDSEAVSHGDACSRQVDLLAEVQTGPGKNELTLLGFSIEGEHKEAGASPSFNEGSFFVHLAHPVHHSTPGFFPSRSLKQEAPGVTPPVKMVPPAALPCLFEETSKSSSATACLPSVEGLRVPSADDACAPSVEDPVTLQSEPDAKHEKSSDRFRVVSSLKGRIQSLPSLNFMEKVGAWNMSPSAERMSDALALPASGAISPRQKACSEVVGSLGKQQSQAGPVPSSLHGQVPHDKKSPRALPFARSQSENSLIAVSKEIPWAEVGHERSQDELRPAEEKNVVSAAPEPKPGDVNVEDPLIQTCTALLVSTVSSDEETIENVNGGEDSNPDNLISSERVAELLREDAGSVGGGQKKLDGSADKVRELADFHSRVNPISMDCFSDVSPDSLNQATSSARGSCADLKFSSRQSSTRSSPVLGKLQSLEDGAKTPNGKEINIEERIPVYLHNLGIDQSPSSILTPFMPRGPIREVEFSPTELRTLKASADLFTQPLHFSRGDSCSVIDAAHSSFNSSTLGVTAPVAGADGSLGARLPMEASLQSSRDVGLSSTDCYQLELSALTLQPAGGAFESPGAPRAPENNPVPLTVSSASHSPKERSMKCVQKLTGRFDSEELGESQEKLSSDCLAQAEEEENGLSEERIVPEKEQNDSLMGSETLKEIQTLLAEAETKSSGYNFTSASTISSSTDQDNAPKPFQKIDDSEQVGFIKGSDLQFQRMWSWDERMTRQNAHRESRLNKALSFTSSLKWEASPAVGFHSTEQIGPESSKAELQVADEDYKTAMPVKRSEPEGCNSEAVNKNPPVFVGSDGGSNVGTSKVLTELQATSGMVSIESTLNILGQGQQVLEKAGKLSHKETGSSHRSGNSSSMDSLSIKVKNLLECGTPGISGTPWADKEKRSSQKQGLVGAGAACSKGSAGGPGSGNGSSLDSLAARVKTLLDEERPVTHAAQILQSAEEEEERAHGCVPDLNEEDRQMIEAIKREHLRSARNPEIVKDQPWKSTSEGPSSHNPILKTDLGFSKILTDSNLQPGAHTCPSQAAELPEAGQTVWMSGTHSTFTSDPETKPLLGGQNNNCRQFQPRSKNLLDSCRSFHADADPHWRGRTGPKQEEVSGPTPAKSTVENLSAEAVKKITSITFASRKRSSPACSVPCTHLTAAGPSGVTSSETQAFADGQLNPGKQQMDMLKPRAPANTPMSRGPDKTAGLFSGTGDRRRAPTFESQGEATGAALLENSPTCCVDPKVHFVAVKHGDAEAASRVLSRMRKYDQPLGGVLGHKSNLEETTPDLCLAVSLPAQKIGNVGLPDCLKGRSGSIASSSKPVFSQGKKNGSAPSGQRTSESYSRRAKETGNENSRLLASPAPGSIPTTMPVTPSSPTRKALSGVHIMLSAKQVDLTLPNPLDAGTGKNPADGLRPSPQPAMPVVSSLLLEPATELKPVEVSAKPQDSANFPKSPPSPDSHAVHPCVPAAAKPSLDQCQKPQESRRTIPLAGQSHPDVPGICHQGAGDNLKTTTSSQTERMSSDAVTQITTESPEKTTYSAEIFVSTDSGEKDVPKSSLPKGREILSAASPAVNQSPILNSQTGKPLLLPYKPPGSSEMYYVPCPKETLQLSHVRSETTVESSHSGSNDAIPPTFPAHALGTRDESPPDTAAVKHREGIYSKRAVPKDSWTEEKVGTEAHDKAPPDRAKFRNSLESVNTTHSVFKTAHFFLHQPVPLQHEMDFLSSGEAFKRHTAQAQRARSAQDAPERDQASLSACHPAGEERFIPLTAEPDYSLIEESKFPSALEGDSPGKELAMLHVKETGPEGAKEQLPPSIQRSGSETKQVAAPPAIESAHFTSSLDELWTKYLERQRQHQEWSRSSTRNQKELSLVERLDRLARLLQNPVRHTLVLAQNEQDGVQENPKGKESRKVVTQRDRAYQGEPTTYRSIGKEDENVGGRWPPKSRLHKIGALDRGDRNLEQNQSSETLSGASSEMQPVRDSSVLSDIASDSEVTQPGTETASRTEASGSVSTIDTARLIRAFGHDRVQASPRLTQLYSVIDLQKTRSEKRAKGSRKDRRTKGPRATCVEPKTKDTQAADSFISSDSVSGTSSCHGPSPALSNKRSRRMLNKAVQAGDFEIVNSATRKHTRDVGLTFPTPASSQARLRGDPESGTEDEFSQPAGRVSESKGKQKRPLNSFFTEKKPRRSKSRELQGVSWFVPADDLKSDPHKGPGSSLIHNSRPSWSEPLPSRKPWREPLREKNWQGDSSGLQVRLMAPARDNENKPPPPFVKVSLQEALAMRRPDFISSSGERVKRLKLIMEERKLQSMLQGEREELFNPPEHRRSSALSNRDYRMMQKKRTISRNEMVQRSKRIYEQLPEVRKRREEEKRKSDYSTNRLKAQLYKMKITNHVLGRKVPWE